MNDPKPELGLTIDTSTSLQDWAELGRNIYNQANRLTWHLADWAAFGERIHGKLKEFCEANNVNYQTLRNHAYIAGSIQMSRRRDKLSFTHHAEVASLPEKQQDRWLTIAEADSLSVVELRRLIRDSQGGQDAKVNDGKPLMLATGMSILELPGWFNQQPPEFWTTDTKNFWKERLEPLVRVYEAL